MSNRKDGVPMQNYKPEEIIQQTCSLLGMTASGNEPYGVGTRLVGDEKTTKGYLWYYPHGNHFVISQCDFVINRDIQMDSPIQSVYIALRLDFANYLPSGKLVAFMEEKGDLAHVCLKKGTRVVYTEVMYLPAFYKKYFEDRFSDLLDKPVEILKRMSGEHNWTPEMVTTLTSIRTCSFSGLAAALFFTSKAYELMSRLVAMGHAQFPQRTRDYEHISKVIEYIDNHYRSEIKQTELIRLSSMSGTKLKILFKQFTGHTITDYIMAKKAEHAAHLLAETDFSIEQIAQLVGFASTTGFTTSFKKKVGVPPSEYRKHMSFYCMKDPSQIKNLSFNSQ